MSLELITQYHKDVIVTEAGSFAFDGQQVSGLIDNNQASGRRMFSRFLNPDASLDRATIQLPEEQEQRLGDFFHSYMMQEPPRDYETNSFVGYMQGWDDEPDTDRVRQRAYGWEDPTPPKSLESGKPYLAINDDEMVLHAMLGTSDPERSLCLFGINEPLYLMQNTTLIRIYGATAIAEALSFEQTDTI